METYSFCLWYSPTNMERERRPLDKPPEIGSEHVFGSQRWRVVAPHVPADSTTPEPNVFDCRPVE